MDKESSFETALQGLVECLYGSLRRTDGCREDEVMNAERRLGRSLPRVLSSCYQIAGQHRAFQKGLQNLLPPMDLALRSFELDRPESTVQGLVFLTERQGVTFSVIREDFLDLEDPPVFQGNHSVSELYLHCKQLSSFLLKVLCWNAMQIHPYGGSARIDHDKLAKIRASVKRVEHGEPDDEYYPQAYCREHLSACVFVDKKLGGYKVFVAAKTSRVLKAFEQDFGIRLSRF